MKITVEGQTYEYDGRLMASEARLLKTHVGMTVSQFGRAAQEEDIDALVFLIWLCRRRAGETDLKFSDVDFDLGSVDIEPDSDEVEAARPTVESPATGSGSHAGSESIPGMSSV